MAQQMVEQTAEGISQGRVRLVPTDPKATVDRFGEQLSARWASLYNDERTAAQSIGRGNGMYTIEVDEVPVGAIEWVEEFDPNYQHARIDLFVNEQYADTNVGRDATRLLVTNLFEQRGQHRVVAAPGIRNERAKQYLRDAGFREVGTLRQYERQEDGSWEDATLMELLKTDAWL